MMRLRNNNIPFSDNLITPTNNITAYAPLILNSTFIKLNLHKKEIENRHEVGINLGVPI